MKITKYCKTVIIALIILYGSVTSSNNLNQVNFLQIQFMDKIIHFLMYFILCISFQSSILRIFRIQKIERVVITLIFVISYGFLMEVFQYYFTKDRSAEFLDALANAIGCFTGIILMPVFIRLNLNKYL